MVNQGLSEAYREKIYWWVTAALLCSTPLLIEFVAKDYSDRLLSPLLKAQLPGTEYLLFLGIGSILAALLFEVIFSKEPKIWIKRPSVTVEQPILGDLKQWEERHVKMLTEAGFVRRIEEEGRQWQIVKSKNASHTHGFTQHAFSGTVTVTTDKFGSTASMTLTFEDIVLIETGEVSKLTQLSRRLLGEESSEVEKEIPLTLCSAVILGVATHVFFYGEHFFDLRLPGFAAAFLSCGEALWMTVMIAAKPKTLIGLRIALAMIVAGGAPFIAVAVGKIMLGN